MKPLLLLVVLVECLNSQSTTTTAAPRPQKQIFTVGIIVTEVQQQQIGFSITGGVIPIALQQIANLRLLDEIEFRFVVNHTDCTEGDAAGIAVYLLREVNVDMILGPPCGTAIIPIGFLSTYYQIPQIIWGFASAATLADYGRFPYLTTISANYRQVGYAFLALCQLYDWDIVGLLYGDAGYGNCPNMINDVTTALTDPKFNTTTIASTQKIDFSVGRPSMVAMLKKIRLRARIIGVCMPTDYLRREFLLATVEAGMNSSDFVYVILDVSGQGFGQLNQGAAGTAKLNNGLTPFWYDTVNNNRDGMDSVAQQAANNFLVIDLTNTGSVNGQTTTQLAPQVRANVRGPPFYCNTTDCLQNDLKYTGIGSFAQQLYDAFMWYALCLNASLAIDPVNGARNQTIFNQVQVQLSFLGWSGTIQMTPNITRVPRFYLYGLTSIGTVSQFVNFTWAGNYDYISTTLTYTDASSSVWAVRGGVQPLATPICE